MTTRRTATRVEIPVPSSSSTNSDQDPTMRAAAATTTAHHSPTLPTRLESLLLAIYPTTLLLGSLFSQLSASSRRATYLPDSQAYSAADAPSYFAKKGNVFNVYFVKIGWFWISLAWAGFVFTHRGLSKGGREEEESGRGGGDQGFWTRRRLQALARYAVVTGVWILVTQWCFGPALIDRSFRWTGGKCLALSSSSSSAIPPPEAAAQVEAMSDVERALTHAACKAVGGRWAGGHDISGHVFLLILGSAMLWLEILPVVLTNTPGLREARRVRGSDGNITSSATAASGSPNAAETKEGGPAQNLGFPTKLSLSVAALSWWMLLMTAAFFHTWFEKFTGLVVAFSAIWGIYFLPRGFPGWRRIVGIPGV
ncbi:hypothetical protein D0862_09006 [Hortaea werneckii]|uniref:Acyl-coenzyme A diphosphatase SCS3 n=1 Tax=Hortaea werneckii TaxID=91943 RepID=A0A3M7FZQ7_HORWE|nr:hypothetical protein D0862_09006 [Hortaea werneckii]